MADEPFNLTVAHQPRPARARAPQRLLLLPPPAEHRAPVQRAQKNEQIDPGEKLLIAAGKRAIGVGSPGCRRILLAFESIDRRMERAWGLRCGADAPAFEDHQPASRRRVMDRAGANTVVDRLVE